jgi:hypothetical protein
MATIMSFEGIVGVMGWRVLVMRFSLKLDIGEDKWLKFFPMSGKNRMHLRHIKTPKRKTSRPSYSF